MIRKKMLAWLISLMLVLSCWIPVYAEDIQYGTLDIEYSDAIGQVEKLDIMIKDQYVYANAIQLAKRLGFQAMDTDGACVTILNNDWTNGIPYSFTQFTYDSKKVTHLLFTSIVDSYEAPCNSFKNDKGIWIPLRYSLQFMNSGMLIVEDIIKIEMPEKNIVDVILEINKDSEKILFDFTENFGYTDTDIAWQGAASHIINQFNGLLEFDGAAWVGTIQGFTMYSWAFDHKYGEEFAVLMCTNSNDELQAMITKMDNINDYLDEDGKLGKFLSKMDNQLDADLGNWQEICDSLLENIKEGNGRIATYNRAYQKMETVFDRQSTFVNTVGDIQNIQKQFSEITKDFKKVIEVGKLVNYANEFSNQDDYSLNALDMYLKVFADKSIMPEAMSWGMNKYVDRLKGDVISFSVSKYIRDNATKWLSEGLKISDALKKGANVQLIAWDLASEYIPFIKNGLGAADKFELSLYASVFQAEAYTNYVRMKQGVDKYSENLSAENLFDLSRYCYVFLKASYITREAAIASLKAKSDGVYELVQPLIEKERKINQEIADYMAKLKSAKDNNKGCIYGFLPEDNTSFLDLYDDCKLVEVVNTDDNAWNYSNNSTGAALTVDLPQLPEPQNILWKGSIACWDAAECENTGWEIQCYKNEELFHGIKSDGNVVGTKCVNFTPHINESGNYQFQVRLLADGINYQSSNWSQYSDVYTYERPNIDIGHAKNLSWSQADFGLAMWDSIDVIPEGYGGRIRYNVKLYKDGKSVYGFSNWIDIEKEKTEIDFSEKIKEKGNYKFSVQTVSEDIDNYANGPVIMSEELIVEQLQNSSNMETDVHKKLQEYYKSDPSNLTVMEGYTEGDYYYCDVRCGVPGNPIASQRIYDIELNVISGEVVEINLITNTRKIFNIYFEE